MLYREIIAAFFYEIHTKHITALCGQNVELLDVKPGGTYSNHWALNFCVTSLRQEQNQIKPISKKRNLFCDRNVRNSKEKKSFVSSSQNCSLEYALGAETCCNIMMRLGR